VVKADVVTFEITERKTMTGVGEFRVGKMIPHFFLNHA